MSQEFQNFHQKFPETSVDRIDQLSAAQAISIVKYGFCYLSTPEQLQRLDELVDKLNPALFQFAAENPEIRAQYKRPQNSILGFGDQNENGGSQVNHYNQLTNIDESVFADSRLHAWLGDHQPELMTELSKLGITIPQLIARVTQARHDLGYQLVQQVIKHVMSEQQVTQITGSMKEWINSFTLGYYPKDSQHQGDRKMGQTEHIDFGPFTMLRFKERGLQVLIEDEWYWVLPKENFYVFQFGGAISVLSGGKIRAATHRAYQPAPDRTFTGLFSDIAGPLNTFDETGQRIEIFPDGNDYLKWMFQMFDEALKPDALSVEQALNRLVREKKAQQETKSD